MHLVSRPQASRSSAEAWGVAKAISFSKATVRNIKQNLFWAFAYNVLRIPVAAGILYPLFAGPPDVPMLLQPFLGEYGFLNPILAAAAMAPSRVMVLANALRLCRLIPVVGMGKIPKMGPLPLPNSRRYRSDDRAAGWAGSRLHQRG